VSLGGHKLKGNVVINPEKLSMVAVDAGDDVWYGQLIMCSDV